MSSIKNQSSASESTIEITYQTVEEALNAIENNNGWDLEYYIPELKNNEEVVMVAIIVDILPSVNEGDSLRLFPFGGSFSD